MQRSDKEMYHDFLILHYWILFYYHSSIIPCVSYIYLFGWVVTFFLYSTIKIYFPCVQWQTALCANFMFCNFCPYSNQMSPRQYVVCEKFCFYTQNYALLHLSNSSNLVQVNNIFCCSECRPKYWLIGAVNDLIGIRNCQKRQCLQLCKYCII